MPTVSPPSFATGLAARFSKPIETHISWVFLGSDEVLKLKKPVRFPFLDFSTLALRKAACEAEVRLNSRLSPDVYLGVEPVVLDADGSPCVGGAGEPIDYAVRMRRLPDSERADVMLDTARLSVEQLDTLAEHLAKFHETAEVDLEPNGPGGVDTLGSHVDENLTGLGERAAAVLGEHRWRELCQQQRADLSSLSATFARRLAGGRVREGHGDLRLDHVYFCADGKIRILDCVEFDRAFRVADVCADVAFFAMNLRSRGCHRWAERFVARYTRDAADHELYALLDFYLTYWALVRAKVSLARAKQMEQVEAQEHQDACAKLLKLAHRLACARPKAPRLIVVGGVIGAGKSRLATRLSSELAGPALQSDRIRKQLTGVDPQQKLTDERAYTSDSTRELYQDLLARARIVLATGRSVIVDGSFRAGSQRAMFRELAQELNVPFLFIECRAPRAVLEQRLRVRETKHNISDARVDLLDTFLAQYEPLSGAELGSALQIDTSGPGERSWRAVRQGLTRLAPIG